MKACTLKLTAPAKTALKEGILPVAGLIGITAVLVAIFALCIHFGQGLDPVYPSHMDEGETVDPNPLRLAFMLTGFLVSMALAWVCARKGDQTWPGFWLGYTGGTLLWQSVGEASWHFGFVCEDYLVCFTHLESSASLWLVIMTTVLLVYCARHRVFSWSVGIFILSFVGNWFGHFVQIGTYPIACRLMEESDWYMLVGSTLGTLTCLIALWINFFTARSTRARLLSALVLYFGLGIIVTGVTGI